MGFFKNIIKIQIREQLILPPGGKREEAGKISELVPTEMGLVRSRPPPLPPSTGLFSVLYTLSPHPPFLLPLGFYFLEQFKVHSKFEQKTRVPIRDLTLHIPIHPHTQPLPLSSSSTRVGHLFQRNLH